MCNHGDLRLADSANRVIYFFDKERLRVRQIPRDVERQVLALTVRKGVISRDDALEHEGRRLRLISFSNKVLVRLQPPHACAQRPRSRLRPTAAVANAPEVFAGKCLERSSCRGSRGKCSCDNNTPVLSRLYQKTKRVIYRSVMPHMSLDASRHAWRHRLKAPRATSGHCGTTSRLVFALCLSSADARSRYAPGGGGRNTTSCFAESATTSGGFCSFME